LIDLFTAALLYSAE